MRSGELSQHYCTISPNVTGIDISPTAIAWAQERLPSLDFICATALDCNALPMNHFDLIIDSNCLHCIIGNDRKTILANAFGWLQSTGFLVLYTMCNDQVWELPKGLELKDRIIFYGDIATRYLGEAESILREVDAAGFLCLRHAIHSQKECPDMLVSLHKKKTLNK